ncbi:hypothetical protein [Vibrio sp. Vb339]|uniref:hypothetical protein n=1 Tax=Vibrio sp. Vb339 TaxID=1192013 RepID=UPI0015524A04|nr:hypothetical protein [Vibrio sp. Vb339]
MAKSISLPKQVESLKSDVGLLAQQLANTSIALKFLKDIGVSEHVEKYIDDILELSEKTLAQTDKSKYI